MDIEIIALISTIFLAFIGYAVTYFNSLRLTRRKERLELVNMQLNELYGPLFVATQASEIAFRALGKKLGGGHIFLERISPKENDERYKEWRIWCVNVLMPLNDYIENVILNKAHLIREEEMPPCLLHFIAHVASFKAVIEKWSKNDYSEHLSIVKFPDDMHFYIENSYKELKRKQLELIGE